MNFKGIIKIYLLKFVFFSMKIKIIILFLNEFEKLNIF